MTGPDYTPGARVYWWCRQTGGRRIGTVASVRQSRRGPVLRILQGDGSTGEPALWMATRNARGVMDFPASEVAPYVRTRWPDVDPDAEPDTPAGDWQPEPGTTAPSLPPALFIEPRDLDGGDGSPLALF